jgi:hypothetical protein
VDEDIIVISIDDVLGDIIERDPAKAGRPYDVMARWRAQRQADPAGTGQERAQSAYARSIRPSRHLCGLRRSSPLQLQGDVSDRAA